MEALFLLSLALAPGLSIGLYFYLKDKHEREPLRLVVVSFVYGVLSACLTLLVSVPVAFFLEFSPQDEVDQFFNAFFKVALIEEFCKFLFLRFILFRSRHFNEPFDGIVYGVMVGMGFATFENILYVSQYGFATGILRMFTAVPAHATFAVLMGYYVGKAKFPGNAGSPFMLSLLGLAAATFFHGAYDFFWFISYNPGIWIGAIISLVIGFVLSRKAIHQHLQISPFRK